MISTSKASPFEKRKHTRHWSLIRILHCPLRSPLRASERFDGGDLRSSILVAALSCVSRIAARPRISEASKKCATHRAFPLGLHLVAQERTCLSRMSPELLQELAIGLRLRKPRLRLQCSAERSVYKLRRAPHVLGSTRFRLSVKRLYVRQRCINVKWLTTHLVEVAAEICPDYRVELSCFCPTSTPTGARHMMHA